jgi:hypothetical protein
VNEGLQDDSVLVCEVLVGFLSVGAFFEVLTELFRVVVLDITLVYGSCSLLYVYTS